MLSLPWGLTRTVPKGWATGGSVMVFWALQEVVSTCASSGWAQPVLSPPHAVSVSAGHLWLISCCLHLRAWMPFRNGHLHGYSLGPLVLFSLVAPSPCPSCWAQPELLPARQEPTLLHPAPVCGFQRSQAGARGRYQGAGRVGGTP